MAPTFDGPLEEHLAAAAGHDPVVAPGGLVRTHQADLVCLPAGLGLAWHCRAAVLCRPGGRAERRRREGEENEITCVTKKKPCVNIKAV